jgi:hypothetical protein
LAASSDGESSQSSETVIDRAVEYLIEFFSSKLRRKNEVKEVHRPYTNAGPPTPVRSVVDYVRNCQAQVQSAARRYAIVARERVNRSPMVVHKSGIQ